MENPYYDLNGNIDHSETYSLGARDVIGRYQNGDPLPAGWTGSIVLEADGSLIAVMREDESDTTSAYNGIGR